MDSLGAAERVARRWLRLQPDSRLATHSLSAVLDAQGRGTAADSMLRAVSPRLIDRTDALSRRAAHMIRAESSNPALRGIYHAAASGQVSWQDYAKFVLQRAQAAGVALKAGPDAVDPVSTSNYPTPARRPLNSRLDTTKLRQATGLVLPPWQSGVARMLAEVITEES